MIKRRRGIRAHPFLVHLRRPVLDLRFAIPVQLRVQMDAQLGQRLEHVVAQLAGDAVPGQLDVPERSEG